MTNECEASRRPWTEAAEGWNTVWAFNVPDQPEEIANETVEGQLILILIHDQPGLFDLHDLQVFLCIVHGLWYTSKSILKFAEQHGDFFVPKPNPDVFNAFNQIPGIAWPGISSRTSPDRKVGSRKSVRPSGDTSFLARSRP